jgi:simple sugar transport system substrate-binding protein
MYEVCDRVEGWGVENSYQVSKEVLATYSDIKGFIGCDMENPPGIAMAVEEAGKKGRVAITGTCLVSVVDAYLKSDTIKTIMFWDPADAGQAMCILAEKVIKGETIATGINLGIPGFENCTLDGRTLYGSAWVDVTKENMGNYNF